MTTTKNTLYTGRYIRMGGTFGCTIPKKAREALGWTPGAVTLFEIVGDVLFIRVIKQGDVLRRKLPTHVAPDEARKVIDPDA